MNNKLEISDHLAIPIRELTFTFSRSGGPGGQNVNKVNSKVMLRWDIAGSKSVSDEVRQRLLDKLQPRLTKHGELILTSQRFRDQGRNIAQCLSHLREILNEAMREPKKRRPTRTPVRAHRRRLEQKRRIGDKKRMRRGPAE